MTADELAQSWGIPLTKAGPWADVLNPAMEVFAINTPQRIAAFLAQIGHESGCGRWVREIWGPRPAQLRYEGRKDLGNLRPGDGRKYLGRGLIQITGHSNYMAVRDGLRKYMTNVPDFEQSPELLEMPRWAAYSAGWFWASHGLNELADNGNFMSITRRINGGTNGYEDRVALWESGKDALGVTA